MTQNIETMRELVERLSAADIAYYKHDNPIVTDREYDRSMTSLPNWNGLPGSSCPARQHKKYPVRYWRAWLKSGIGGEMIKKMFRKMEG